MLEQHKQHVLSICNRYGWKGPELPSQRCECDYWCLVEGNKYTLYYWEQAWSVGWKLLDEDD